MEALSQLSSSSQMTLTYIELTNTNSTCTFLSFENTLSSVCANCFTPMEYVPIFPSSKTSHPYVSLPCCLTHPLHRPKTNHTHFEVFSCSTFLLGIRELSCFVLDFSAMSVSLYKNCLQSWYYETISSDTKPPSWMEALHDALRTCETFRPPGKLLKLGK